MFMPSSNSTSSPVTISTLVDRVCLVNLKRRTDRLSQFQDELKKGWPLPEPIIYNAIDGNLTACPKGYESGHGAWGCLRSHQRILEDCVMDGIKSVLVLEDDATIYEDFTENLETFLKYLPDDWGGIMLGGQHIRPPEKINDFVDRCTNCQRTHAYIARGDYLKKLYRKICEPGVSVHVDWVMGPFHMQNNVYAPRPFLVGQRGGQSDVSGNNDPKKFWISPKKNAPVIVLKNAKPDVLRQLRRRGLHTGFRRNNDDIDYGLARVVEKGLGMREWLEMIQWECVSERGLICTAWHPKLDFLEVKRYAPNAIEVDASSYEKAIEQIPVSILNMDKVSDETIVLLRSRRDVFEGLMLKGWHGGYWRDNISGADNGLRDIVEKREWERLKEWADVLFGESNGQIVAWLPNSALDVDMMSKYTRRKVVEICADTVDQAVLIHAGLMK